MCTLIKIFQIIISLVAMKTFFFFFLNGDLRTLSATDTCTSVVDH